MKRDAASPSPSLSPDGALIPSSPKAKITSSPAPTTPRTTPLKKQKSSAPTTPRSAQSTPGKKEKGEAWSAQKRIKLFEAYVEVANIDWNAVAAKMGDGTTGKMCREQWQRGMGKKIRKALEE